MPKDSLTAKVGAKLLEALEIVQQVILPKLKIQDRELQEIAKEVILNKKELSSDILSLKNDIKDTILNNYETLQEEVKKVEKLEGKRGTKGDKGESGEQGARGFMGQKGDTGEKGQDGSPDKPDEIVEKINTSKTKIKAVQIEGLIETTDKLIKNISRIPTPTSVLPLDVYNAGSLIGTHIRKINFTSGASFSNDTITVTNAGGGGFTIFTTASTIDDSNVTFVFTGTPTIVVINGQSFNAGATSGGVVVWTNSGATVTLANPVGVGGSIYSIG